MMPDSHALFTLPEQLRPIALGNPKSMHTLLFDAAVPTLQTVACDLKQVTGASWRGSNTSGLGMVESMARHRL